MPAPYHAGLTLLYGAPRRDELTVAETRRAMHLAALREARADVPSTPTRLAALLRRALVRTPAGPNADTAACAA